MPAAPRQRQPPPFRRPAATPGVPSAAAMDRADLGARARLRAGQSRHPAGRAGRRLHALLPAQPEALPAARRSAPGDWRLPSLGRGPRHPHRPLPLPRVRATANWSTSRPTSRKHWRDDLVSLRARLLVFVRGRADAGRHRAAPHHQRLRPCRCIAPRSRPRAAGPFHGPLVVSMRPLKPADAIRAIQITTRFPAVHGAPVHIGMPELIGIKDIMKPDYGDAVPSAATTRCRCSGPAG